MLFISKTLQYPSCACVRNIRKIVTFVTEKVKLVSFNLFLDAFPPRPKMPFGQWHVAINIYNICKGRLGSKGGGGNNIFSMKKIVGSTLDLSPKAVFSLDKYQLKNMG